MFESTSTLIKQYYKSYISAYVKFIFLLTVIGFIERCFFAVYHRHLSEQLSVGDIVHSLVWGIKFDLALSGFLSLFAFFLVYLFKRILSIDEAKTLRIFAYLFGSLIFFVQGGDILYFSDAARHIGYEITNSFNDAPHLLLTAWSIYKVPLLFHLALYVPLLFFIKSIFSDASITINNNLRGVASLNNEGALLIAFLLSVVLARGGIQSIPLEPIHAQELSDHSKATLALNGSYNAIFNIFNKDQINPVEIKLPAELNIEATLQKLYPHNNVANSDKIEWKPNIIFIFLESWPAMYMQSYGYGKNTTPFFDSLREKSLTTSEMMAGGHRTTEGMFASLCSAQNPLGKTVAQSQLQDYQYNCLPKILRDNGYHTVFFQGSNENTSGTGAFAQLLGFTESYGKADIEQRIYAENSWGVYDQDLYNFIYPQLKNQDKPFVYGINTNTTHDITIPKSAEPAFKLSKKDPRVLNSLYFADQALKEFFNKVNNDPEIGDTLWVIVGDHTAGLRTTIFNNYRVPFLIYGKNKVEARHVKRVASHRDIAPTMLDILGFEVPEHFTGKLIQRTDNPPYFADYFHSGTLGWVENSQIVQIPLNNPENLSCFTYKSDKIQHNDRCSISDKEQRNNALAFTSRMQSLLFNGKLSNWKQIKLTGTQ